MNSLENLRLVFAGTPEFAARHLSMLLAKKLNVIGVYTQPDRPAGRGKKTQASAVKKIAESHELPIFQPASLKDESEQAAFKALEADVFVVVAYGLLLPRPILDAPRFGCFNVHGSILPRWRGAAPIQRAIEAGDTKTGITIMQMDEGLDTGDMLKIVRCSIEADDTSQSLHDKLADIGPDALYEVLKAVSEDRLEPSSQDNSQATYAKKIEKSEAQIDWQDSAFNIDRKIRAFNPFPIAFTLLGDQRFRVHHAQAQTLKHGKPCAQILSADGQGLLISAGQDSALNIKRAQLPGKRAMSLADILNGMKDPLKPGDYLG